MRAEIYTSFSYSPEELVERLFSVDRRVLFFGESGIGKSTLAADSARILGRTGRPCICIGADPGSPAFGVPGAVCLGRWQENDWQLLDVEALCTLDAARFRLPLVAAVQRLAQKIDQGMLFVDAPGVIRGVAGAELLGGIVEAAAVDVILVLAPTNKKAPLENELETIGCQVVHVEPAPDARPLSQQKRRRQRTRLWDKHLGKATGKTITLSPNRLTGTPPPLSAESDWRGRQLALLKEGRTLAIGEVLKVRDKAAKLRIAGIPASPDQYLLRDAWRNQKGWLVTHKPAAAATLHYVPPPDVAPYPGMGKTTGPRPVARIGEATATLVNGIFGDPLLHLRLHNQKRSILFDLGEGGRLPAKLAHQVTDVFISHAHIDHISGFLWLMRSRIGEFRPCRLFGPPGLTDHIAGLMTGIHWDRIGEWGPRFEVTEIHEDHLVIYTLQAGKNGREKAGERAITAGLIKDDPSFKVWAVTLDHGATPVLAYGLAQPAKFNIKKDRLIDRGLAPGSWLGQLKRLFAANDRQARIQLPDGRNDAVESLADELIHITPSEKLVYATDLADMKTNRIKLTGLAQEAHTFFCEAAFCEEHRRHAERSGHLTARACGEIARAAGVENLVPFHFSRRYEKNPLQIYDEVRSSCERVVVPQSIDYFSG